MFHPEVGKQKRPWSNIVMQGLKKVGKLTEWKQIMKDRKEWGGTVAALVEDLIEETVE